MTAMEGLMNSLHVYPGQCRETGQTLIPCTREAWT
jgi:hypothetical protein